MNRRAAGGEREKNMPACTYTVILDPDADALAHAFALKVAGKL
jgi:hypothetical protein